MSGDKPWDKPWSMDEIISNSDSWNLAGDVALLNTIKAFADGLLSRTNAINTNLQSLTNSLNETSLQLNIAENEFQSLRNTQFIESRVYEDDESLPEEENKPKDEEKIDHTEDIKLAALKGLEILDQYFDKVEVSVSDSEDDDIDLPNYVLRPKDMYIQRPLPYVIGSEEWHKSLHVGLEDSSSDSETEKVSDQFSESDSESELPIIQDRSQIKGTSDTSSEFEFSQKTDNKAKDFLNSSDSENSVPTTANRNFAEQLAAKLGTVIQDSEPEINTRPIQPPRTNYGDVFFDEPPPLDEPKGLFSGGAGLFDDEDEKFEPKRGLFDGDDSTEDIFGKGAAAPPAPLFTDEPPTLEEKKKPVGGISIFGGGNVFDKKLLRRQKSSSDEEEEVKEEKKKIDLFGDEDLFKNSPRNEETFSKTNTGGEKLRKTVNLFDSDEEEEAKNLFVGHKKNDEKIQKDEKIPEEKIRTEEEKPKISLFDDDLFKDDLFSTNTKKSFTSGLFDDIPEDNLFEKPKLSSRLFDDLDIPDDKNSINSEDRKREDSPDKENKTNLFESPPKSATPTPSRDKDNKNLFDSPPRSDFLSSTPHATPAPNMRLFDSSPPPDDEWDRKSENLENLSDNDDLLNDFPETKEKKIEKRILFSEEPPSLDFKPSPKKPGKLKHNLNINVGALVPGSTPPKRNEKLSPVTSPDDVITSLPPTFAATSHTDLPVTSPSKEAPATSFDEADNVQVLQSVTKHRAKVTLKRRPSTRRGRKAALRNSMTDFKLDQDEEETNEDSDKTAKIEEKQRKEVKLFDQSSESEDFFTKSEKIKHEPQSLPKSDLFESSTKDYDLFASLKLSQDDLFGEAEVKRSSKIEDNLFGTSVQEPENILFRSSQKVTKIDEQSQKDLFENLENPTAGVPQKPKTEERKSDLKSGLFDEPSKHSRKDSLPETSQKIPRNDDLFPKMPEIPPKTTGLPKRSLFEEPSKHSQKDTLPQTSEKMPKDEDLFRKMSKNPPKMEEARGLFDDDDAEDDLFTSKKTIPRNKIKKALFDDDDNEDDDIFKNFSSTSAKRTESKVATEKKVPKISGVKKLENTKSDEDPLSALLK